MCVLNRRADVAKICLGKMGLFRGARALRAVDQDNPDTKIAVLAIHLNMKVCLIGKNFNKIIFYSNRKKQKRFYFNQNNMIFLINCINQQMNGKKRLIYRHIMIEYIYVIHIIIMRKILNKIIK
jgi:hypothetical protein